MQLADRDKQNKTRSCKSGFLISNYDCRGQIANSRVIRSK